MPTTAERHALLFLSAVAVIGGGVRAVGANRFTRELNGAQHLVGGASNESVGDRALSAQISAVDSARATKARATKARRPARPTRGRPVRPATQTSDSSSADHVSRISAWRPPARTPLLVDVNRATQAELERLPRVGPALAARIISWREQHGPYRSIDDLRHVRGIGAVTVALLAPSVTF